MASFVQVFRLPMPYFARTRPPSGKLRAEGLSESSKRDKYKQKSRHYSSTMKLLPSH